MRNHDSIRETCHLVFPVDELLRPFTRRLIFLRATAALLIINPWGYPWWHQWLVSKPWKSSPRVLAACLPLSQATSPIFVPHLMVSTHPPGRTLLRWTQWCLYTENTCNLWTNRRRWSLPLDPAFIAEFLWNLDFAVPSYKSTFGHVLVRVTIRFTLCVSILPPKYHFWTTTFPFFTWCIDICTLKSLWSWKTNPVTEWVQIASPNILAALSRLYRGKSCASSPQTCPFYRRPLPFCFLRLLSCTWCWTCVVFSCIRQKRI